MLHRLVCGPSCPAASLKGLVAVPIHILLLFLVPAARPYHYAHSLVATHCFHTRLEPATAIVISIIIHLLTDTQPPSLLS